MPKLDANPRVRVIRMLFDRWLMAAAVVFSAYNPSGYSYYHWVTRTEGISPLQVFAGLAIFISAVAIVRMAFLSVGYIGSTIIATLVMMAILLCVGLDFIEIETIEITTYTIQFWISFVLAVGMGWSFIQRRISGERDVIRVP